MKKVVILALCSLYINSVNAQLFTNLSLGLTGNISKPTKVYGLYRNVSNTSIFIYGATAQAITATKNNRIFLGIGLALLKYNLTWSYKSSKIPPSENIVGFIPNVTVSNSEQRIYLNIPITIGYRFIQKNRFNLFATATIDKMFIVDGNVNYKVKDSINLTIVEYNDNIHNKSYNLLLLGLSVGIEIKNKSGRMLYRLEPFLKMDSKYILKPKDYNPTPYKYWYGAQLSVFYNLIPNKN